MPDYAQVQKMIVAIQQRAANTFRYLELEGFIVKQPNGLYDYTPEGLYALQEQMKKIQQGG